MTKVSSQETETELRSEGVPMREGKEENHLRLKYTEVNNMEMYSLSV